jgi:hypothetical protein
MKLPSEPLRQPWTVWLLPEEEVDPIWLDDDGDEDGLWLLLELWAAAQVTQRDSAVIRSICLIRNLQI